MSTEFDEPSNPTYRSVEGWPREGYPPFDSIGGLATMAAFFKRLVLDEEGATMVEYALMVALIAAALVTVVTNLKTAISGKFTSVSTTISGS